MTEMPLIRYEEHPGFAGCGEAATACDDQINVILDKIDSSYERILTQSFENPADRTKIFDDEITPNVEELKTILAQLEQVRPAFSAHVINVLSAAERTLRSDLDSRNHGTQLHNSDIASLSSEQADRLAKLKQDGFFQFSPDPKLAQRVFSATTLERAVLRKRARKTPKRHCVIALHPMSPAYEHLKDAALTKDLIEIASAYMGKPMEFLYAALDHAHPGQNWYKDCYADVGLPTAKTVYMHFDAGADILKAMLYLKDVGPQDGPFGFVRGSHHWQRSPVRIAVQKGFDQEQGVMFEMEDDQLDYKQGYYRPLYKHRQYRSDIMALPKPLRGTTHFGDDIVDGSELSDTLLGSEEVFTAQAGTVVLFDGARGIHRGSLVESGSRWAIQLAFRVKHDNSTGVAAPAAWRKALRGIRQRLHYTAHSLRNVFRLLSS